MDAPFKRHQLVVAQELLHSTAARVKPHNFYCRHAQQVIFLSEREENKASLFFNVYLSYLYCLLLYIVTTDLKDPTAIKGGECLHTGPALSLGRRTAVLVKNGLLWVRAQDAILYGPGEICDLHR